MSSPFWQFYKKVVLRLSEHGDVIENANNKVCPPQSLLAKSVPGLESGGNTFLGGKFCFHCMFKINLFVQNKI